MKIEEFADIIDKQIIVRYYPNQGGRFSAEFEHSEIKEGAMLAGIFGNGQNPAEAISQYARKIRGARIIFNAMSPDYRVEYVVPKDLA